MALLKKSLTKILSPLTKMQKELDDYIASERAAVEAKLETVKALEIACDAHESNVKDASSAALGLRNLLGKGSGSAKAA